jgi:hypothetical protein
MENYEINNDDEEIDAESEYMFNTFPKAQFEICIPMNELDKILTDEKEIIILDDNNCTCFMNTKVKKNKGVNYSITGDNITYRYVIEKLIEYGFKKKCNHMFLEGIGEYGNSRIFFLCWGS